MIKVKEFLLGVMEVDMKENLIIIIFMEKEYINGEMVDNIAVSGKMIRWKEKVISHGQMEERNINNTNIY